jgi:DNA helicase HerA-like ATPase
MLGEVAYLMNRDVVQLVVNRGMETPSGKNSVMVAGAHTLYRSPALDVLLDTDALFRRHLGIFGFTGAGKSNLLSTLISSALDSGKDEDQHGESNVLLFDVNNEYFGLLVDCLTKYDAHVVFIDDEISDSMSAFLDGDYAFLNDAANDFLQTTTLSSTVAKLNRQEDGQGRARILEITTLLLGSGRFKRYAASPEPLVLAFLLENIAQEGESLRKKFSGTGMKKKQSAFGAVVEAISSGPSDLNRNITIQDFDLILTILNLAIGYCASDDEAEDNPVAMLLSENVPKGDKDKLYSDLLGPLKKLHDFVSSAQRDLESPLRAKGHSIDVSGIVRALRDDKRTLMIFLGSENSLRIFSEAIGTEIYNLRRRNGIVDPATIFIFDEADIFIPGQAANATDEEKDAIRSSKKIATTLARRGRKYGLGLGIATQRITYLDTSILAQIGSYFVGRLPRMSDRQKITEGFGIEKDSLQSGIRDVGDWVVLSHTAVGDRGAPLPVHFNNADERVVAFIKEFDKSDYPQLSERRKRHDYLSDLVQNQKNFTNPISSLDFLP